METRHCRSTNTRTNEAQKRSEDLAGAKSSYLYDLYKRGDIEFETGREFSTDVSIFEQMHMGTYTVPRLESIKHL